MNALVGWLLGHLIEIRGLRRRTLTHPSHYLGEVYDVLTHRHKGTL